MQGIERTLIRRIHDAAPPGSINLGLGQPDLPTPGSISLAGIRGIVEGRTAYTSTAGDPAVRTAVAARYPGFATGPESVVVTVGSQEAVFATVLTLVDAGDEVLVPDPGYPAYPVVARLAGASAVPYPLGAARGFRLDPAEIERRLTERTRLVVLCSPSNPTGAVDRAEDLERLAWILGARGIAWLSDEIYASFAYDGPVPSISTFAPEGGVVVSGLSKDLSMTGWRIGWVAGPAAIAARIIATHQYLVTCASSVSQAAALAALAPAADAERARHLEIFRGRRAVMAEELAKVPGIRFEMPGGAFYFFVDVSRHGSSLELCRRILERRRVITIPGEAFGEQGKGFVRISYAASEDDIRRGIRAMASELGSG
jgi:aspartate aminotransferase